MSGQRESFGSVSFHAGADAVVRCSVYPDAAPILSLDAGRLTVSITVAGRTECSPEAVAFAQQLADKAATFAAECERMHAAQPPRSTPTPKVRAKRHPNLRGVRPDVWWDGREFAPSGRPRSLPLPQV